MSVDSESREMTRITEDDDRVRAAVDAALRRHHARKSGESRAAAASVPGSDDISHWRFGLVRDAADDGDEAPCLIEPSVRCNHCGYCVSYGH